MNKKLLLVAIASIVIISTLVYIGISALDPINQYYKDGNISMKSGQFSKTFLYYLQNGPSGYDISYYKLMDYGYPTAKLELNSFFTQNTIVKKEAVNSNYQLNSLSVFYYYISSFVEYIIYYINPFTYLTINASATCGGSSGTCYWIGGTGNFSQNTHWSASSGGASCTCTPSATDSVVFDANSGAGTATQDNSTFTSGAVTMTNSSLDVSGSSHTWEVAGNWLDANTHFVYSTSTIKFTTNATITTSLSCTTASIPSNDFYNLSSSASVSITLTKSFDVRHILNIGNNSSWTGGCTIAIDYAPTFGTGITTSFNLVLTYDDPGNFPGGTFISLGVFDEVVLTGSITTTGNSYTTVFGITYSLIVWVAGDSSFTTSGWTVLVYGSQGFQLGNGSYMIASSSHFDVTSVNNKTTSSYITSSINGSWIVRGSWINSSNSSSWSFSSGISFKSETSQTMYFGNLTQEFNGNVSFNPVAGTSAFTIGAHALKIGGTLTIQLGSLDTGTVTLTDITNNEGIAAKKVIVGLNGILSLGSGTYTFSGDWDSVEGTFIANSSTVTLSGVGLSNKIKENGTTGFYDLIITGAYTLGTAINISSDLTISGSSAYIYTDIYNLYIGSVTSTGTDSYINVTTNGTLSLLSDGQINFKTLNVTSTGEFKDDSVTITIFYISTNFYPLRLVSFTVYDISSAINTDIEFTIQSSVGFEATIIFKFSPLPGKYILDRNGSELTNGTSYYGTGLTFVHSGGWNPSDNDSMKISFSLVTNQFMDTLSQDLMFTAFAGILSAILIFGYYVHKRRR